MTDNHNYNEPSKGTTDWHVPINSNWQDIDTDVEVRDTDANRSSYTPKSGAKFVATDSPHNVYLGDGANWNLIGELGELYTDEKARDAAYAGLVGGADISVTVEDANDEATVAYTGGETWNRYHREGTLEDGVTYTDEYIDGLEAATDEDIEVRNPFFNLVGSFDGVASDYQVSLMEVNGTGEYVYDGETFIRDDVVQLTASAPSSTGPALNIRLTRSQSASQQVWFGFEWRRA